MKLVQSVLSLCSLSYSSQVLKKGVLSYSIQTLHPKVKETTSHPTLSQVLNHRLLHRHFKSLSSLFICGVNLLFSYCVSDNVSDNLTVLSENMLKKYLTALTISTQTSIRQMQTSSLLQYLHLYYSSEPQLHLGRTGVARGE